MPEFAYTARTAEGQDVNGLIAAETRRDVLAMLTQRSLFPMVVEPVKANALSFQFHRPIKTELLATTLTQLSDLLANGVPLLKSLDVLAEQSAHPRLKEVLSDVRGQVAEGKQLNEAMSAHPDVFNELTLSIVRAGTEGAFLEEALNQTAEFMERQEELVSRIRGAMAYPAFLLTVGSIVMVVLLVVFVPKFSDLFASLERTGTLPFATVALLAISDFVGRFGLVIAAVMVAVVIGFRYWAKTAAGRLWIDRTKIRIPVFGPIFLNSAVSRFCRILGTLMRNGVPLLKALDVSSDSAGNVVLSTAIRKSSENISAGETLSGPLSESGLIPSNIMAMISIAEESNNLDHVLNNVANNVDRKIGRQLDTMVRLIEPALLVVLGGAVLFVIVALLLPVFEMSNQMG